MTDLPEKKKQLTKNDRILIDWFIWKRLFMSNIPDGIEIGWDQAHASLGHGGNGWNCIRQGATGTVTLMAWYQNIHKPGSKEWRPAIIIRAALATANGIKATEYLKGWLATYHRDYTIEDVAISPCNGYLRCTKPCRCTRPPFGGYTLFVDSGKTTAHYHTIGISGITGFGRGRYAFWRALKAGGIIPMAPDSKNGGRVSVETIEKLAAALNVEPKELLK